jgi:outer membrane protein assembly factor BamA
MLQAAEKPQLSRVERQFDTVTALDSSSIDSSSTSLIGFPVIYRTPETRWAFGAAASLRFSLAKGDANTPDSQVRLGGAFTQEKQILIYMPFQLYSRARKWAITGELGYYDYSYFFYGIGDVNNPDGELYDIDFPRVRISAVRKVANHLYAGLRYSFEQITISELNPEGELIQGVVGSAGGIITGIGPIVEFDSRDNVYNSNQGSFLRLRFDTHFAGMGSDYSFKRMHVDARHFIPIKLMTLGLQIFYEGNTSGVPFTHMALLGGGRRMRGYYKGYYRDRAAYSMQSEIRSPILGRLGAVGFIAVGESFFSSPDLQALRWAGGGGLRFLLERKKDINIRIDYGRGEEGISGFYVTIGEAF